VWRISTSLSLLLLLTTVVLWIMSYWCRPWLISYSDHVMEPSLRTKHWCFDIDSRDGRFSIQVFPEPDRWDDYKNDRWPYNIFTMGWYKPFIGFLNVHSYSGRWYVTIWGRYWPLAIISSILPLIWSWRALRRYRLTRRRKLGQCATCGYDLRATPDRCPECGTIVEQVDRDTAVSAVRGANESQ
jgi:hypothetical protein